MNKTYRSIWNEVTGTFVAVAETIRGCDKRAGSAVTPNHLGHVNAALSKGLRLQPLVLTLMSVGIAHAAPAANAPAAHQLPTGGQVVAGQASMAQSGTALTINQASQRAVIDWASFNLGASASVNFVQPSASSAILNRVLDANPSQILGRINANGQVFLTNASGIYFGKSATINVGALTATTHNIGNDDFMAGRLTFSRNGASGSVVNEGNITAALQGYVALLAPEVRNNGVVVAQMGTVALAAGEVFELQFDNARLANLRVAPATIAALVENGNAVQAPGGLIILSAQAASRLQGGVVNNTGRLEATGWVSDGGTVRLTASDSIRHSGSINVDAAAGSIGNGGTATLIANLDNLASTTTVDDSISARGGDAGGNGGFVETSGGRVQIGDQSFVDTRAPRALTGLWLLDPGDYTVAASGGNETGAHVSATLATTDYAINVGRHIHVNDNISWSSNKLTLHTTGGDININAVMTANDTASLDLEAPSGKVNVGFNNDGSFKGRVDFFKADGVTPRSGTGFLTIGGNFYTVITALGLEGSTTGLDLQGINSSGADSNLSGYYALGANIDASPATGRDGGRGFKPIGPDGNTPFTGVLDGLGHVIDRLTINRGDETYVGLFGATGNATIRNIGLTDPQVSGQSRVGALIGQMSGGNVSNAFAGTLSGSGRAIGGTAIRDNYGNYNGGHSVGGLVGYGIQGSVSNSHATVEVRGRYYVGGLMGYGSGITVDNSYATGGVIGRRGDATDLASGGSFIGGLVGYGGYSSTINKSYATGTVIGAASVGGLVGGGYDLSISKSYATGDVSGSSHVGDASDGNNQNVGGLIGSISGRNFSVSKSYASGRV
ncbi:MAG: filamentous hemagglutinin N-terminal domain-containing protein, partial [Rhodoferax sp.]